MSETSSESSKNTSHELEIPPALPTGTERLALVGTLFFLFLLPLLLGLPFWDRSHQFNDPSYTHADFPWIQQKIFKDTSPVDVLFVGPSNIWWHIYTPHVKEELSKVLGREAEVLTFGHHHLGPDLDWILVSEILQRRKVHLLVLGTPRHGVLETFPHLDAFLWWIFGRDSFRVHGLGWFDHLKLYGVSVIGSWRNLKMGLTPFRDSQTEIQRPLLGAFPEWYPHQLNFDVSRIPAFPVQKVFLRNTLQHPLVKVLGPPISSPWKTFIRNTVQQANSKGTKALLLYSPMTSAKSNDFLGEREAWDSVLAGLDFYYAGFPPSNLLAPLSPRDRQTLYEKLHLLELGSHMFTRAVTPFIIEAYNDSPEQ